MKNDPVNFCGTSLRSIITWLWMYFAWRDLSDIPYPHSSQHHDREEALLSCQRMSGLVISRPSSEEFPSWKENEIELNIRKDGMMVRDQNFWSVDPMILRKCFIQLHVSHSIKLDPPCILAYLAKHLAKFEHQPTKFCDWPDK